jgi:hypothetical protein
MKKMVRLIIKKFRKISLSTHFLIYFGINILIFLNSLMHDILKGLKFIVIL